MIPIQEQEKLLLDNSWEKKDFKFVDPISKQLFPITTAYDMLCLSLLENKNWKVIIEFCQITKLPNPIKKEIKRYQSPITNRIYVFSDAQLIVENNFDEDEIFPKKCTEMTIKINNLLGSNFKDSSFNSLYYLDDNKKSCYEFLL